MTTIWSGEVPDRGLLRYVLHRGRHWWQEKRVVSGGFVWCTTWGEPGYLS